jgi:hypothetical protein
MYINATLLFATVDVMQNALRCEVYQPVCIGDMVPKAMGEYGGGYSLNPHSSPLFFNK